MHFARSRNSVTNYHRRCYVYSRIAFSHSQITSFTGYPITGGEPDGSANVFVISEMRNINCYDWGMLDRIRLQWNLSTVDTFWTKLADLYREVYLIQRYICTQLYVVGTADSTLQLTVETSCIIVNCCYVHMYIALKLLCCSLRTNGHEPYQVNSMLYQIMFAAKDCLFCPLFWRCYLLFYTCFTVLLACLCTSLHVVHVLSLHVLLGHVVLDN